MSNHYSHHNSHHWGAGFGRSLFLLIAVLLTCGLNLPSFAAPAQRIVSINLCTDQYLLALADKKQILALSPFARDEQMSFYSEKAQDFALIRDDAESVIKMKPDLVLASIFNSGNTIRLIRRQGIKVVVLGYASSLQEIGDHYEVVAKAIGYPGRGKVRHAAHDALLEQGRNIFQETGLSALYYQRGGYASGRGSLTGLLLAHTGLKNQADRYGIASYGSLSLEHIVSTPPDIFMIAESYRAREDQGHKMLKHPALLRAMAGKRLLRFPVSETVCPGPSTAKALERLIDYHKNSNFQTDDPNNLTKNREAW